MFKANTYTESTMKIYQLKNEQTNSWLTVCPERGGVITGLGVNGEEQLYLDEETLFDRSQDVQGGVPILFPISGRLEDERYKWQDHVYQMSMHGFARQYPWKVGVIAPDENEASIQLRFSSQSHPELKQQFPFDFELVFSYTITSNQLTIDQSYRNLSNQAMPIYSGFHPYFKTKNNRLKIKTDATKYLNHASNQTKPLTDEVSLKEMEGSVILVDGSQNEITTELVDHKQMLIESGPEFRYTVFWTERGKDFVCIEPWMALPNELNEQTELVMIEPNDELTTFVRFTVND